MRRHWPWASPWLLSEAPQGRTKSADAVIVGVGSARKVQIWLLIGSGVVAAAQIGKAIISIPTIRTDMALGLDLAGLIVATFATLGAFFGLGAGVLVRRSSVRRSLIVGMGAITIGNLIGAAAPNEFVLLIARIVEGAAIPSMLVRIVTGEERDFVMAMWSAYVPAGIMLMLLIGPLLPRRRRRPRQAHRQCRPQLGWCSRRAI